MPPKTFFFRVDASPVIGTGHVVRCLNLARQLTRKGAEVVFLSRELPENFRRQIDQIGCVLMELTQFGDVLPQNPNLYETWLGCSQIEDAKECEALIGKQEDISLIVDHYGVNEEWLGIAKKACSKLIVIDDLAERKLDVDVVINQNLGWIASDYAHLVGQETKLLLGPQYAILAENYATARQKLDRSFKSEAPLRALVSLGGADNENISGKVARFLERMETKHNFVTTIVVGPMNPNFKELNAISQRSDGKIVLIQGSNNLVEAYLSHDIAIGAVGSSSWERCCLGLPTILVPIAENQKSAAKKLDGAGAGILVNYESGQFGLDLHNALDQMSNFEVREEISQRALDICDGEGAARLCDELVPLLNS